MMRDVVQNLDTTLEARLSAAVPAGKEPELTSTGIVSVRAVLSEH
jgi:hypothetical protein